MHILNWQLKEFRVQLRLTFDMDDNLETGSCTPSRVDISGRPELVLEMLRKVGPIRLCEEDERTILRAFKSADSDGFNYKDFLALLNAVDAAPPAEASISLCSISIALLLGIIATHERLETILAVELPQRLPSLTLKDDYTEYPQF